MNELIHNSTVRWFAAAIAAAGLIYGALSILATSCGV
jgi:hypothetical protein